MFWALVFRLFLVLFTQVLLVESAYSWVWSRTEDSAPKQKQVLQSNSTAPAPIIEQVTIHAKSSDSDTATIARKGVLYKYKQAQANVLICHGFMCDKFDVGFLRNMFPPGKFNLMTFDFRAHGENARGQCCTFGKNEAFEVQAAADFIKSHEQLKGKPLFVYGFSMGAVAAIEAQSQRKLFDAMVLDCPFDSVENVIKQGLDNLKFSVFGYQFELPGRGLLEKYSFHPYVQNFVKALFKTVSALDITHVPIQIWPISPAQSMQKVSVPCFFIHCKNDEKISVTAAKNLFDSAAGYKKLWITNGRRHFDSFFYNPEKYVSHVQSFFDSVLSNSYTSEAQNSVIEDDEDQNPGKVPTQGLSNEV